MVDFNALGHTEEEMKLKLSKVKVNLFRHKGAAFLASIMGQTEFIWDDSPDCQTAYTNGLVVAFNPHFFLSIPEMSRVTVLAHELWHIAFQHVLSPVNGGLSSRLGNRDPEKWNEAADHVINLYLEEAGYSFEGIENCYKDRKYKKMGTEEVYKLLPDKPKSSAPMSGSGKPIPMNGDLQPTPAEKQIEVIAKVVQAVQSAQISQQAGDIPGEIIVELDKFLNPKLPWRFLLRRFFTEQSREDYSWKRPNRRYDEYLPSLWSEDGLTIINYYLDISGSISDGNILRFNSEVKHIKEEFKPELLNLITFDTRIRDIYSFTEDEPFEKIIVTGRGGTDLRPVAAHIKKTKPNVAVIFSDLWVDPMPPVGDIPVLWIVIGNPNATVPFGQMVHIDDE